jgi:hypothetical protein
MRFAARTTGRWASIRLCSPPLRTAKAHCQFSDDSTPRYPHRCVQSNCAKQDPVTADVAPASRVAEDPAVFQLQEQTLEKWTKFFAVLGVVSAVLVR